MSKALINFFILLIVCTGLSATPINSNILNLDIRTQNKPNANNIENNEKKPIPIFAIVPVIPSNSTLTKPKNIEFEISASDIQKIQKDMLSSIIVSILKDGKAIKTSSSDKLGATIALDPKDKSRGRLKIPLSYSKLGIISGYYTVDIKTSDIANPVNISTIGKQFTYNIVFYDNKVYNTSNNLKGSRYTLYYGDMASNTLIPMSDYGYYGLAAARSLGTLLSKPLPVKFGIKQSKPDLFDAKYTLINGTLTVNFDSKKIIAKSLATTDNTLQIKGLVESALANDLVSKVALTVDDVDDITILNTTLDTNKFSKKSGNMIFIGFTNKSEYLYQVPYKTKNDKPDMLIKELATASLPKLKIGSYVNPVPSNVELLGYKKQGLTLILDFNKNILGSFGKDKDYVNLMIDSIVNTMTKSTKYKRVKFTVEGEPLTKIGDVELDAIYYEGKFLNPVR